MRKQVGLQGEKVQAIKELSSFFNAVNQAVFHFKPNGFDSRKAKIPICRSIGSEKHFNLSILQSKKTNEIFVSLFVLKL